MIETDCRAIEIQDYEEILDKAQNFLKRRIFIFRDIEKWKGKVQNTIEYTSFCLCISRRII